jgi:Xaa-Pro aminopeptidase
MSRRRIAKLRDTLAEKGLDAFVVSSLNNIRYLTGFSGSHAVCVIRPDDAIFVTDPRYRMQSKMEVRGWRRMVALKDLFEFIGQRKLLAGAHRIGFESRFLTYAQYRILRRHTTGTSFVPTTDIVESISLIKETEEVELIRSAVSISDQVFHELLAIIRPGVTELDIAAEISYRQRRKGAEKDAFEPIVASGEHGALPHARASTRHIRNGEMLTLDFGCTVRGYNSDITRTLAIGKTRFRKLYNLVRHAQQDAIDSAKGGMWAKDLDAVARVRFKKMGVGKYFNHSLGHGLGLQLHERPKISALSSERLSPGSVITIEPGLYIPGEGGVRIEDDVLLTANGCEVLSTSPKDLITL